MTEARSVRIRGVVQGVGFRPHVFRLARANALAGWVLNHQDGVEIHLEGGRAALQSFFDSLLDLAPPASVIQEVEVESVPPAGCKEFTIRPSERSQSPTAGVSPDLAVCVDCLDEMFDAEDRRYRYPYINCTNCGPRYTVVERLPYDRANTTMRGWELDDYCHSQYQDPGNRRFHAQPVACSYCGPHYRLQGPPGGGEAATPPQDWEAISQAARLLAAGKILAIKGLGGYHLACDATQVTAVESLRERKFRKEKPFALMARDLDVVRDFVEVPVKALDILTSQARPIVLMRARRALPEIAPANDELGVMLPYAPLHHLLFAAGAPSLLVMTSANRSSEPIAYQDEDAFHRLVELADAFLVGERPIARRIDDSVVRATPAGPMILRRARGYAPAAVAEIPSQEPILAVGADLKSSVTLVVHGQAFVSQHIGDLSHYDALRAFRETIADLTSMYEVDPARLVVVSDAHPQYHSTAWAAQLDAAEHVPVQHHRAHVASVLAERGEWSRRVVGVSFDGTGYGDDGSIWGGEFFVGCLESGFARVAHLRTARLAGGDAAARHPVQAAAGFLSQLDSLPDFSAPPFSFPDRFQRSLQLLTREIRTFETTSAGRLFDALAALVGFTRPVTFEGQAAMWLQFQAQQAGAVAPYPFPFVDGTLDFRPLLQAVIEDRRTGRAVTEIARAAHTGIAAGIAIAVREICQQTGLDTVVLSGGVFQNAFLVESVSRRLLGEKIQIWTNHRVPPNDGGISLGQAAMAAFHATGRRAVLERRVTHA